ncbi:MAG: CvpA family protein [Ignavibacteriaceae bacterium]|nr:CvpA family protein [Ignavibacteriaceae bacterium]
MSLIDLIIILAVGIGFIFGFKDGIIRKLIGITGLIIAVFLAVSFSSRLGRLLESVTGIEYYLSEIVAGVLIFSAVVLIASVIKRIVHPFDRINNLLNQILGGIAGTIQMLFFLSAVFLILNIFNVPGKKSAENSLFYTDTMKIIPFAIEYLGNYTTPTDEVIRNYINEKDTIK